MKITEAEAIPVFLDDYDSDRTVPKPYEVYTLLNGADADVPDSVTFRLTLLSRDHACQACALNYEDEGCDAFDCKKCDDGKIRLIARQAVLDHDSFVYPSGKPIDRPTDEEAKDFEAFLRAMTTTTTREEVNDVLNAYVTNSTPEAFGYDAKQEGSFWYRSTIKKDLPAAPDHRRSAHASKPNGPSETRESAKRSSVQNAQSDADKRELWETSLSQLTSELAEQEKVLSVHQEAAKKARKVAGKLRDKINLLLVLGSANFQPDEPLFDFAQEEQEVEV